MDLDLDLDFVDNMMAKKWSHFEVGNTMAKGWSHFEVDNTKAKVVDMLLVG